MENIPALLEYIDTKCPKLQPLFLPVGLSDAQLLKKVESQKKLPKHGSCCEICSNKEGEMKQCLCCKYDLPTRKASVYAVKTVCPLCYFSMSIQKIMELLTNKPIDDEEVDAFCRHFLLVNEHNPNDRALLEEILSCCYSAHIVLKSLLSPTVNLSISFLI